MTIPEHAKVPGQAWPVRADGSQRPRCYKCQHWRSNMPLTGRCALRAKRGLWTSHDLMPGDGCKRFEIRTFPGFSYQSGNQITPHPNPLPQGEGIRLGLATSPPLPGGED